MSDSNIHQRLSPVKRGDDTARRDLAADRGQLDIDPAALACLERLAALVDGVIDGVQDGQPESQPVSSAGGGGREAPQSRRWLRSRRDWLVSIYNKCTLSVPNARVEACSIGAWSLELWRKKEPLRHYIRRWRCWSWRHAGECRRAAGRRDYARVKVALGKRPSWVYLVLTFDRKRALYECYRDILACWKRFAQRLRRRYGKIEYISLVEQHRDGYPHLNVLVHNREFCALAAQDWRGLRREWNKDAQECGFGLRFWLEPMRQAEALNKYLAKLAEEGPSLAAEVAKTTQAPIVAPRHFRRLRASQGLLPSKLPSGWTGRWWPDPVKVVARVIQAVWSDVEVVIDNGNEPMRCEEVVLGEALGLPLKVPL